MDSNALLFIIVMLLSNEDLAPEVINPLQLHTILLCNDNSRLLLFKRNTRTLITLH